MKAYDKAAAWLREETPDFTPDVVIVLGSGLGELANKLEKEKVIPYSSIPGFEASGAPGHAGNLILCRQGELRIAVMQGRHHFYEGRTMEQIVLPLRAFYRWGAKYLIVTNASGGINLNFEPGDIMLIKDHIKFAPDSPLRGDNDDELGVRFPDMTTAYDKKLGDIASECAERVDIALKKGVYMYMTGPQFETPAEIRALRTLGADAVGMSTVPEVIAAAPMGMRTLGMSLVTNAAAGVTGNPLSHEEVLEAGEKAKEKFSNLIIEILKEIADGHAV